MNQDRVRSALIALRSRLPSISDRNVVEIVALLQHRKAVVRLVLDAWEWLVLREALPELGLSGRNAKFQLRVRVSTRLGDRFTVSAPWSDHDAGAILVYIAHTPDRIDAALALEETPESLELGRLLGYPDCCVAGYGEIVAGRPWVEKVLDTPERSVLSLYANKLGYLFRGSPSFLPDFYPCSLACAQSARLGRENCQGLHAFGLGSLATSMKAKLSRPIVYMPGLLAQLPQAHVEGEYIVIDTEAVNYYEFGFPEGRTLFSSGRMPRDSTHLDTVAYRMLTFVDDAAGARA